MWPPRSSKRAIVVGGIMTRKYTEKQIEKAWNDLIVDPDINRNANFDQFLMKLRQAEKPNIKHLVRMVADGNFKRREVIKLARELDYD